MKKSEFGAPGSRVGVLLKPGEKPGKLLQMRAGITNKRVPCADIVLVSILGGLLILMLAVTGLWIYRWTGNSQALISLNGDERNLYRAIAFGTGLVITAVALTITTARKSITRIESTPEKRRAGSSKLEEKWRRRS